MIYRKSIPRRLSVMLLLELILMWNASAMNVTPAHAAGILYATPVASGIGDCSSWEDACTLQTALSQSEVGNEVWVKTGVYYPGAAGNRAVTFPLRTGVALFGGFVGTETERYQRDWKGNSTILSGDIDGNDTNIDGNFIAETWMDIQGDNAYHVIVTSVISPDVTAVLDGFIITAGQTSAFSDNGGGIYNSGSNLTLANLTITGNSANQGGGMYNLVSNPTLTNVTFTSNAASQGGGMYNEISNPTLTNITFISNTANQGGGLYNHDSGHPQLTSVTFFRNTASAYGGAMVNEYNSSPTLTNVIFVGNSADQAGEIYNHHISSPTMTNVTFAGNSTNQGGGIMNGYYSWPVLVNAVIWGNTISNGTQIYNDGDSTTFVSYSDVQGCGGSDSWNSTCGTDNDHNIDNDPLYIDLVIGNLHLVFDSPAVDMGTPTGTPRTDIDGNPRDARPDMGAYEYQWLRIYLPHIFRNYGTQSPQETDIAREPSFKRAMP